MTGPATLGTLSTGRDNNLNLIRAVAATGVLVSHAWPIALGPGAVEPLKTLTGFNLGTLCVFLFFVVSGFLIAGSWDRRPEIGRFLAARALRLFPGLIVSLLLVALVMGPLTTTLHPAAYLTAPETWSFLIRNTTLAFPQFTLPGVFEANPYPTVEGSIWTLIHEALCYLGVLLAGIFGLLHARRLPVALGAVGLLWLAVAFAPLHPRIQELHGLALPFLIGMAFYAVRDRLELSGPVAGLGLLAALALVQVDPAGPGGALSLVVLSLTVGYATFWAAYLPAGPIRGFNRFGDYSYGIYIYAFPVQGLVIWAYGAMSPWMNIALAIPLTLLPSILSWHLVERPALALLKRRRHCTA